MDLVSYSSPVVVPDLRSSRLVAVVVVMVLLFGGVFAWRLRADREAAAAGSPRAVRAVGTACATNPMPIVIPCHRLIGTDGKLHGYGGGEGLRTKEWLLKMERAVIA